MPDLDHTHDPGLRSWVASANGHQDFPIQNLPLGVFSPPGHGPRGGVAIGDSILDLAGVCAAGLLTGQAAQAAEAASGATLNSLLAAWREELSQPEMASAIDRFLVAINEVEEDTKAVLGVLAVALDAAPRT